jgi:hypothetical protein
MVDYGRRSQEALERANKVMEKAMTWGIVVAVLLAIVGILKRML